MPGHVIELGFVRGKKIMWFMSLKYVFFMVVFKVGLGMIILKYLYYILLKFWYVKIYYYYHHLTKFFVYWSSIYQKVGLVKYGNGILLKKYS